VGPILELLKGQAAQDAGIVYLQDEKYEFQAKPGGRVWSVWGSPVRGDTTCNALHLLNT
jgi:hypothetical protein